MRCSIRIASISIATLALVMWSSTALAQPFTYTFFPSNTVINTPVTTDFAIVGYSGGMFNDQDFSNEFTGPSSPTIHIATGANIPDAEVFNNSIVNVTGGAVAAFMYHNSQLHVSGGTVQEALGFDSAEINISGGTIEDIAGQCRLVNVSGGLVNFVTANTNNDNLGNALGSCIVNVTGGTFTGEIASFNQGILNLHGGQMLTQDFRAAEGGTLNIFGSGLSAQLTNSNAPNGYSVYTLSGVLSDGNSLAGMQLRVRNDGVTYGHSTFNLINIPAPGAACALAIGGLAATRRRRA